MAGHSHAANIAHKKAAMDKKRGKIFSKIARKIIVAARIGGPDVETNLSLKYAFELARAANMPKDVIQRNIEKGAGTGAGGDASWEEVTYEGYGPGGVAILVDILTDNRNRTAGEVKKIFDRAGGNLGSPGCVSFLFETKAFFVVEPEGKSEDEIMEIAMAADADDLQKEGDNWVITADQSKFTPLKKSLVDRGLKLSVSEITKLPKTWVAIDDPAAAALMEKLVETLEDQDDVQNVYANHEISDETRKKMS